MSLAQQRERVKDNVEVNAAAAEAPPAAEAPVNAAVAEFLREFRTESGIGLLMAFGEEPMDFQRRMESLLEELNPQRGMESELADQIGQTFWRMRRFQRMQDGLALKSIQNKVEMEEMVTAQRATQALALAQPFRNLAQVLARRGQALPAGEVEEFAKSRRGDDSPEMREFIALLTRACQADGEARAQRGHAPGTHRPSPTDGAVRSAGVADLATGREGSIRGEPGRPHGPRGCVQRVDPKLGGSVHSSALAADKYPGKAAARGLQK